jgi:type I restriction enzyme R subunit
VRNFSLLVANEADTCRKYVVPRLQAAGWEETPHSIHEQCHFTAGRIVVAGRSATRQRRKRADYLLRSETLGLTFAYATNGEGIVEFDFSSGLERDLDTFPSPTDLWRRLRTAHGPTDEAASERFLEPSLSVAGKEPRYYQEIAVNRWPQSNEFTESQYQFEKAALRTSLGETRIGIRRPLASFTRPASGT